MKMKTRRNLSCLGVNYANTNRQQGIRFLNCISTVARAFLANNEEKLSFPFLFPIA